jgi:hypothetical protein
VPLYLPSSLGTPSLQAWASQPNPTEGVLTPGACSCSTIPVLFLLCSHPICHSLRSDVKSLPLLITLIAEQFRENSSSTCVSILTFAFDILLIVTLAGLRSGPAAHKFAGTAILSAIALVLIAMILAISLSFRAINRFVATSNRTHDLGVLILLGASSRQILELRLLETLVIAIPGAAIGILLTLTVRLVVVSMAFPFLTFGLRWEWFVIAIAATSGYDLIAAYLATWIALRKDLIDILSSDA